jgi:hypothetical protein
MTAYKYRSKHTTSTLVKTTPHATGGNKKKRSTDCRRTEQWANENKKVGCCNKYLVITVRNKWTTPLGGEEFYVIKKILMDFIIIYGL